MSDEVKKPENPEVEKPEVKEEEKKDAGAQGACGTGFYCGKLVRYS